MNRREDSGAGGREPIVWLVEDNSDRSERRPIPGVRSGRSKDEVTVRLHRIQSEGAELAAECFYKVGESKQFAKEARRVATALELLDSAFDGERPDLVVAGSSYGCSAAFLRGLAERSIDFVVELRPSTKVRRLKGRDTPGPSAAAAELTQDAKWAELHIKSPLAGRRVKYSVANLGRVSTVAGHSGCLFVAETGGIQGLHRGTVLALHSGGNGNLRRLLGAVSWVRWIRPIVRRQERENLSPSPLRAEQSDAAGLLARANISLAERQDSTRATRWLESLGAQGSRRGVLSSSFPILNVVELFAGAGGMGLGFLMAEHGSARYRLTYSAEVNLIYLETLRRNHKVFAKCWGRHIDLVPEAVVPLNLRQTRSLELIEFYARQYGDLHVLIGGPPCQGFSAANRNSWHSNNPHNQLVDIFVKSVKRLRPLVFVMENVQGVLWTGKGGNASPQLSVAGHVTKQFARAGYVVFPKLLDAVWYGIPQYRSRFFVVGMHKDLGYKQEDFGEWGPFPLPTHGPGCARPYVTVRQAIGDLPPVANGEDAPEREYSEPSASEIRANPFLGLMRMGAQQGVILDHVTSRHADYVIERYRHIPQGGNWQDIADRLTNYADVERTHSNIYRRLKWSEPSITIGHYRKSMLVHPSQHRGFSLREAARLQSFPDWFRFSGGTKSAKSGLVHKQQQLANAVCPLVTKALAEFILQL